MSTAGDAGATALYDFEKADAGEATMLQGDRMEVLALGPGGEWVLVSVVGGERGLVPLSCALAAVAART